MVCLSQHGIESHHHMTLERSTGFLRWDRAYETDSGPKVHFLFIFYLKYIICLGSPPNKPGASFFGRWSEKSQMKKWEKWGREMRKFWSQYIKEWVLVAGNWDSVELGSLWETITHLGIVSPEDGVTGAFTYPLTPSPLIGSELATRLKRPPKIRVLSRTSEGDLILN